MALPSTAITRLELSSTFSEFDLAVSRLRFIGPRVFRPRLVGVQAADVGKVVLEQLLDTKPDDRAPGGEYKRDDFEFTKFSYATDEHGREAPLDDRTLRIFRDILDAEDIQSQRAQDKVLRNYEIDAAAALYDTATWTGASLTTAITNEWDDATNGVPITDIEAAKRLVRSGSGLEPNALVCNRDQFWNAMRTDQVIDLLKYWGGTTPRISTWPRPPRCSAWSTSSWPAGSRIPPTRRPVRRLPASGPTNTPWSAAWPRPTTLRSPAWAGPSCSPKRTPGWAATKNWR